MISTSAFADTYGTYAPANPVNCRRDEYTKHVHRMRVLFIENNSEEFVVHLSSVQGRCYAGSFLAQTLDYSYEATLLPVRLYWKNRFDADFRHTEDPKVGMITLRFEKKLFKKHASHDFDFYYGVYGLSRYPLYFKWYVNVTKQDDNNIKFNLNFKGMSQE